MFVFSFGAGHRFEQICKYLSKNETFIKIWLFILFINLIYQKDNTFIWQHWDFLNDVC